MRERTIQAKVLAFHNDEDGIEQLNIVMIVAIAALVLMFIYFFWESLRDWAQDLLGKVIEIEEEQDPFGN